MLSIRLSSTLLTTSLVLALGACSGGSSNGASSFSVTGSVTGSVTSTGGAALDEYVALLFSPASGGASKSVNTDVGGNFTAQLDPGEYSVFVKRPGYADKDGAKVTVNGGQTIGANFELDALAANTYIGSAQCGVCHDSTYQVFRQSGHPYKLNKVNGAAPSYPFTSLTGVEKLIFDDDTAGGDPHPGTDNTLGTPAGWEDITYVIGGFNWKARFIDKAGYIVTGSKVQYNYRTDAMSGYHDNEVDKPFNCGNCHTTGWKHYDATVNNARQDNLPGMHGTFAEQGIGCESCHGAGSVHAQTSNKKDVVRRAAPRTTADFQDGQYAYGKAVSCGECHTRDGEKDYPTFQSAFDVARTGANKPLILEGGRINASGGLIRHHEQFDEIVGIDPDTLDSVRTPAFTFVHGNCIVCHDPHKAGVHRDKPGVTDPGVSSSNSTCLKCHPPAQYDPANNLRPLGSMKNLNCVDCHMPKLAKSATSRLLPNGVVEGDVTSHIFSIKLDGPQFTQDGKHSYPYLSFDFSCRTCHGDETFDIPTLPAGFNYHPDK